MARRFVRRGLCCSWPLRGVAADNAAHRPGSPAPRQSVPDSTRVRVEVVPRELDGVFRAVLLGGKPPPTFRSTAGSVTAALDATTVDRTFGALARCEWGGDRTFSARSCSPSPH